MKNLLTLASCLVLYNATASAYAVANSSLPFTQANNFRPVILFLTGAAGWKSGDPTPKKIIIKVSESKDGKSGDVYQVQARNFGSGSCPVMFRPTMNTTQTSENKSYLAYFIYRNDPNCYYLYREPREVPDNFNMSAEGTLAIRASKDLYWTIGILDNNDRCWGRKFKFGDDSFDSKEDNYWRTTGTQDPKFNLNASSITNLAFVITPGFSGNDTRFITYITTTANLQENKSSTDLYDLFSSSKSTAVSRAGSGIYSYAQMIKQSNNDYCN